MEPLAEKYRRHAEIVDRTALKIWGGEFEGLGTVRGIKSCTVLFLTRHFLLTCSDTFADTPP